MNIRLKKRIIALSIAATLILPTPATPAMVATLANAAEITKSEDFHPDNAWITFEVKYSGILKTWFEKSLRAANSGEVESIYDAFTNFADGKRLFMSMHIADTISESIEQIAYSMPITDDEWEVLLKKNTFEKNTYKTIDIYGEEDMNVAKIGDFLVLTFDETEDLIHNMIDIAHNEKTNSLSNNSNYMNVVSSYLSPKIASMTFNLQTLFESEAFKKEIEDVLKEEGKLIDMFKIIEVMGGSVAEMENGFRFNFKLKGNEEKLNELNLNFNPQGSFTPSLYKKFPNEDIIYYSETYNIKAQSEAEKQFEAQLAKIISTLTPTQNQATLGDSAQVFSSTLENIYEIFEKELAFAIQYNEKNLLPYVTALANVESNTEKGIEFKNMLLEQFKTAISKNKTKNMFIRESGDFFTLTIRGKKINYWGMNFELPSTTFTVGVTSDGYFVVSNYPDIEKPEKRTGATLSQTPGKSTGYLNFSMSAFLGWMEKALGLIEQMQGPKGLDLSIYKTYYNLAGKLNTVKDIIIESHNTNTEAVIEGSITTEKSMTMSFASFIEKLKTEDQDGDGISDYAERYKYFTPADVRDSDNDGVNDVQELEKGSNPKGEGKIFNDLPEEAYYTKHVALLKNAGAVQGYADGNFRPGNIMTRAEYTAMVVQAFYKDETISAEEKAFFENYKPFEDVKNSSEWYFEPIMRAYNKGLISRNFYTENHTSLFRPNDPINRAEALKILSRASNALKKESLSGSNAKTLPFKDVSSSDWFSGYVGAAYKLGIVSGKTQETFAPGDVITRAEAATLIERALLKDLEMNSRDDGEFPGFDMIKAVMMLPESLEKIAPESLKKNQS